jgi:hypothetical protein
LSGKRIIINTYFGVQQLYESLWKMLIDKSTNRCIELQLYRFNYVKMYRSTHRLLNGYTYQLWYPHFSSNLYIDILIDKSKNLGRYIYIYPYLYIIHLNRSAEICRSRFIVIFRSRYLYIGLYIYINKSRPKISINIHRLVVIYRRDVSTYIHRNDVISKPRSRCRYIDKSRSIFI